jgi:hypothetical protein
VQFACSFRKQYDDGRDLPVSFRCKSAQARNMRVVLIERDKPWEAPGWAGNSRSLTMADPARLFPRQCRALFQHQERFFLGETSGDVWIDDVSIVPVDLQKL